MKILKGLSRKEFKKKYGNLEQCLEYLAHQKWGKGYCSIRCKNTSFCPIKSDYKRRCTRCGHNE